jgi:hypothetical protein
MLAGPIGSLGDKIRIARLRRRCRAGSVEEQLDGDDSSTLDYLRANGLGPSIIERFLRPFLGGVFLDRSLTTSSRMFRFVFRMFSEGSAILPSTGMQAIPDQLAAKLPRGMIRTGVAVDDVAPGRVVLRTGDVLHASDLVIATDGTQASRWLDGFREPSWRWTQCLYFTATRAPISEPILILNGDGTGPINNLCFPTRIVPEYGPGDRELVSVTVLDEMEPEDALASRVHAQLIDWFGVEASDWRHLRSYRIRHAVPHQPSGWLVPPQRPSRAGDHLYVAGDHLDTASTNGALQSGRRAADAIIVDRANSR